MTTRTIAVVDGNSLLHRAFHALPETMTAPDGRPTNAAFGFVSMLVKLVQELAPDAVVVAFDRGKPVFRTEVLERYKVHRPPTAEALKVQFPMVKELLAVLDVPVVESEGWEGDDILGTLARMATDAGDHVLLVTGDRDALQLVTDRVQVVTTKKGLSDITVYGPAEVEQRYGVRPDQIADYLGLKGDASDNIPGVPGIGEKTAAKLLQEHGSLDALLENAGDVPGKLGESLREHADMARASRTVATISTDVPVEVDLAGLEFGRFDAQRIAAAFGELRFTTLLDRVLALADRRGAGTGTAEDTGGESVPAATVVITTGSAAIEMVERWLEAGGEWLGVATGEGDGECLFAERRDLGVAGPDGTALVSDDVVPEVYDRLLLAGRLAAADTKSLLQFACPPDEAEACAASFDHADADRLFDVGIACYLLESGRSSFDVPGLSADYLGSPLPEPTEGTPAAAIEAQAVCDLRRTLEERLDADESLSVFRRIEMPLVPVLVRMERVGVGIDTAVLDSLGEESAKRIDELRGEIYELAGCEFTVDSPKQLSEVLFERLGLPPQKRTKTGYSTDASVLAALAPAHPIAEKIVSYRELTKLKSTYIDALPRLLGRDGRLHTSFNQTVAATGRLSSSSPNLQNIPIRTEFGRRIRAAFIPASPGDVMVSADYSQIELRILAHLSKDPGLIEAFTSGRDFHTATAARVFGVDPNDVPTGLRSKAKAVNFGIVYGQSAHGLAESLGIPHAEAQEMIDRYYDAYPGVRAFLDQTVADAHRTGCATTIFGRKRRIPELKSSNYGVRSFGERTAMNHPMQGTAADIMKLAMIEVDRGLRSAGLDAKMVLQVHDELVFECPPAEADRLGELASAAMSGVAELEVPLEVSVAAGPNWALAK